MKKTKSIVMQLAGLLFSFQVFSASIQWSQPTVLTNSSQLISAGANATVIEAYNTGGASGDLSVDGVTFTAGVGSLINTSGNFKRSDVSDSPTGNANLNTILSSIRYTAGTAANHTELALSGLNPGQTYKVQIFCTDNRSISRNYLMAVDRSSGGPTDWDYTHWGSPDRAEFVTGTCTADSVFQSIVFEFSDDGGSNYQPGGVVVNAYLLTAVPTPVSIRLISIQR